MAESWVRLWAGMTSDTKWQTVARKSGQPRYLVIAIYTHLMMLANEAEDRGDVSEVSIEDIASAMDCDEDQVSSVIEAMQGRVIEGSRLVDWKKFQAPAENYRQSAEVWMVTRMRIFERDDFTCAYCGKRGVSLECDHVIPVSQGGSSNDDNLTTACRDCNRSKGAKTPEQWRGE